LRSVEEQRPFEAITADYVTRTAVERELVLRLASLLWRMRRATDRNRPPAHSGRNPA
jgi:hypothetical protein